MPIVERPLRYQIALAIDCLYSVKVFDIFHCMIYIHIDLKALVNLTSKSLAKVVRYIQDHFALTEWQKFSQGLENNKKRRKRFAKPNDRHSRSVKSLLSL